MKRKLRPTFLHYCEDMHENSLTNNAIMSKNQSKVLRQGYSINLELGSVHETEAK